MENSKSNYDILQDNKTKVLKFAKDVFAKDVESSNINKDEIEAKLESAKEKLSVGGFSEAISLLDEIKDNKLGIIWHKSGDLDNGTEALVRDARNITDRSEDLKKDAGEKYAMQVLNLVRASIDLLGDENDDKTNKSKEKLKDIALGSLENIDSLPERIKEYNSAIVEVLKESGMEDVEKKLQFAKEIQNFNDEHKHIVTLSSARRMANRSVRDDKKSETIDTEVDTLIQEVDTTIIEADIMLNGLTDTQEEAWKAIANREKQKLPDWYNKMEPYQQTLLQKHAGEIAKGNKVIPTQLLSSVPGIKNGYLKVTAIEQVNGSDPKILLESLHCGAPATKIKNISKEDKQKIVDENVKQLQSFVEDGRNINLNILTSKTPFNLRGEDFISNQIYKAKNNNVVVSSSPLNRWGWLGAGRDNKVFKGELKSIADSLSGPDTKNVAKFLKNGSSFFENLGEKISFGLYKSTETKAKDELGPGKIVDANLAKILEKSIEARKLIDSPNSPFANLKLNVAMDIVEHAINSDSLKKAIPIRINFCKSGKDRTGILLMKQSHEAICCELGIDPNSEKGLASLLKQVSGGHTQEMAGIQGGSIGCHSIKTNPEFGLEPIHEKVIGGIINQKSSSFNSNVKLNKDPKKQDDLKPPLYKKVRINEDKNQDLKFDKDKPLKFDQNKEIKGILKKPLNKNNGDNIIKPDKTPPPQKKNVTFKKEDNRLI
jgi:hypothetical protein